MERTVFTDTLEQSKRWDESVLYEPGLCEFVNLAAAICGTARSAISLIQGDRVLVTAWTGHCIMNLPLQETFCCSTVQQDGLLEVPDAREDPRFACLPRVVENKVRFYAGLPIFSPGGDRVGALCVTDTEPRTLNKTQRCFLMLLVVQLSARLQMREQEDLLQESMRGIEQGRRELEASERRFKAFMNCGPFMAYLKDGHGRIVYYNDTFRRALRPQTSDMLGKTDAELWDPEIAAVYRANDLEVLSSGQPQVRTEEARRPNGHMCYWQSYRFPVLDEDGELLLGGLSLDVSVDHEREAALHRAKGELQHANEQLQELATRDALTGVFNRRAFDEQLQMQFQLSRRNAQPLSVMLLDVDHFKQHNDRYGHASGDAVLRKLADLLASGTRKGGDFVSRIGGEEFVILLPGCTESHAIHLAESILQDVRRSRWENGPVTVSAGVAEHRAFMQSAKELLQRADRAMYSAKLKGRDRVCSESDLEDHAAGRRSCRSWWTVQGSC